MLICDMHADTLWAHAAEGKPATWIADVTKEYLTGENDTRIQAMALFVYTGGMQVSPTAVERELAALEQLKKQGFVQIRSIDEAKAGQANVLLTIEGGEAFGDDCASVMRFAETGVRAAALTWNNENRLGYPAVGGNTEGLTPFGREIVRRMQQGHMAVDVSHLNVRGMYDTLDFPAPPMASHSCAHALCPHPRNLTDDQLKSLFSAGGFVGINFYPRFLSEDGRATIDSVIDHMAHMCDLGGEDHVGLGSDFDGIDEYPEGLRNAGDVPALFEGMRKRGFDEALIQKIAGLNCKQYFERIETI